MLACALSMLLIELMFAFGKYKKDMYSNNYKKPNFNNQLGTGSFVVSGRECPSNFQVENNTF